MPFSLKHSGCIFLMAFWQADARGVEPPEILPSSQATATEVRAVFAAKCAGCHGADLPKPQGRFGYVLDLRRLAGNPEMVIPFRPDESELWVLVNKDEMPPADSPKGPLTATEKEAIRNWVAAGAPDALSETSRGIATATPVAPEDSSSPIAEPSNVNRLLRWVGKFHLLVLHFPIALMVAAAIGELAAVRRRDRTPPSIVRFCCSLAAVAVVAAVALGWLHAATGSGIGSRDLLTVHRWLGTAAGVLVIVTAVGVERDARRGARSGWVRASLAVAVALTAGAAHFGGLLMHGRDFFNW